MFGIQWLDLLVRYPRRVHKRGAVARNQVPFKRLAERTAENGSYVRHSLRREPLLGFFIEKPLDVLRGEFVKLDLSEGRLDVQSRNRGEALNASWLCLCLEGVFQPVIEELRDSLPLDGDR